MVSRDASLIECFLDRQRICVCSKLSLRNNEDFVKICESIHNGL